MSTTQTLTRQVWFRQIGQCKVAADTERDEALPRRLQRITELMAHVIRYDQLLKSGHIGDFVELSELGGVTRARITQIMNLRLLAPDIQEAILFLPETDTKFDPISERDLRPIVAESNWATQRKLWKSLVDARL